MPDVLFYWRKFWRGRKYHAFPAGARIAVCGAEGQSGPGKGRPLSAPFPYAAALLQQYACPACWADVATTS